ncbi:MAG: hypothetical protein JKY65_06350 [Planctomycetes bacterium]|nr:hypothetical protein [Planctomycetota bacterium]
MSDDSASAPEPVGGRVEEPDADGFEAELRAEIQDDLDERLAEEDGAWNEEHDDDDDAIVMRPFPGLGAYNPIVGGGSMIAAFEEDVPTDAGYLVAELPGEQLLVVEGPRPGPARQGTLALATLLCFSPCVATGLGLERLAPRDLQSSFGLTVIAATIVGLILAVITINYALYDPGRVICTSEGLGIETKVVATWLPWEDLQSYTREAELFQLFSSQGEYSFLATPEEAARIIELLDQRGIHRGVQPAAPA